MTTRVPTSLLADVYSKAEVNSLIGTGGGGDGKGRTSTLVIAASDTVNKESADVICTGLNDNVLIQSSIRAYKGKPLRVLFRAGYYNLSDEIVIDQEHITLEGEIYGFWDRYHGSAGYQNFPRADYGPPGASTATMFVQKTANKGVFRIGTNYPSGHTRYGNIAFIKLGFYGPTGTGTCIYDNVATDFGRIIGCNFHGFATAIDVKWDHPIIMDCNIQDTAGPIDGAAVRIRGFRGYFVNNGVFQVGGVGLVAGSIGMVVSNNIFGATNGDGIIVSSGHIKVIGNQIMTWGLGNVDASKQGILVANLTEGNAMDKKADGFVIVGNNFQKSGDYTNDPIQGAGRGGGNCVQIGGPQSGNTQFGPYKDVNHGVISGNQFDTEQITSGKAISLEEGSNYIAVTGNAIRGPFNNGNDNGKIARGSGPNNKFRGNTGDGTND